MNFLIADDHAIVRTGLMQILREEFRGARFTEACNSSEVRQATKNNVFDVILLDISMRGQSGIDVLKQLRADGVKAPILMLSIHAEEQYAIRALKAGASGFLNKEAATEQLLAAVHQILTGKKFITRVVAEKLLENPGHGNTPPQDLLSDRELQVLQLIASGKTASQIASELSLSVNTVSTYRSRLLQKLALKNNAELTRFAIDHNLSV